MSEDLIQYDALYSVGLVIRHRLFNYRGVIVDVDPRFMQSDEWYEHMAPSRPPKDRPWYRVLVHNAIHETYVAERNLELDTSDVPVNHPDIDDYFVEFRDGVYVAARRSN